MNLIIRFGLKLWHDNKFIDLQDLWDGPSIEDKKQAIKNNFTAKISNKLFFKSY